jgi:hypothetical protein
MRKSNVTYLAIEIIKHLIHLQMYFINMNKQI